MTISIKFICGFANNFFETSADYVILKCSIPFFNFEMHDNRHAFYLHIVWSTKRREPLIFPATERAIFRVLRSEAHKLGCDIVALNGTGDHVHLLLHVGPAVSLARIVNQLKGVSAWFVNHRCSSPELPVPFCWQDGYGVASVGVNQLARVIDYIDRQKEHHQNDSCHADWEPIEDSNET